METARNKKLHVIVFFSPGGLGAATASIADCTMDWTKFIKRHGPKCKTINVPLPKEVRQLYRGLGMFM